jgi:hypothetical protein
MLQLAVLVHLAALRARDRVAPRLADDAGQASAEYALVLLGVAGVAMLVGLWARNTDRVGKLFDVVFDQLVKAVK